MLELARWMDGRPGAIVPGRIYGPQHWSTLNVPDVEEFTDEINDVTVRAAAESPDQPTLFES